MGAGQLITTKHRGLDTGYISLRSADEDLAARLPELRLPRMSEQARAAFRAVLAYERPPANGSVADVLRLVEARGFSAHPCDWIPEYSWQLGGRHPALYQPWVDWLSEQGLTKFHKGNTLTAENCKRWSKGQRRWALIEMIRNGRDDDFRALKDFASTQPGSIRAQLVEEIDAWGSFVGCYPWQTPLLEYFLNDRVAVVRDIAAHKLGKMGAFTTEEAYAQKLAGELIVTADCVRYREPPEAHMMFVHFYKDFACVNFDALAAALGLAPTDLARRADLDDVGQQLINVAARTGDAEVRSILATRLLDLGKAGEHIPLAMFLGVAPPSWKDGLRAMFASPYWNSVEDYLGSKTGSLDSAMMREWPCSHYISKTVIAELERGELPVNMAYDPLRVLGKVVDKHAAAEVRDEALAAGMAPDNPRLTMLKLNLAL
ncbi:MULTISPECIES: hypothetical protein [Sphingobium]|uniref:Uncharacterized protein n=1 Tax=Sphingobium fuliginis (strain ATCC 27551) TaxID=336203 RepID=A0ABQ1ELP7_SPHSA|nr:MULTISPECIES: hypothetical protein [Sphingobium]RYM01194.1 hypothetical protein EWH10_03920 [Sphingobium fuliginis]WDA38766.1 hypothetical protein PO876_11610 [Sphingobium sp. YC-XJ3]GFZ77176.1 hypothetical protein GCM10019071_02060 [Sphingobium fuliginis]